MTTPAAPQAAHPLSGLLAFWTEAGVDIAYAPEAVDRLAEGARRLAPRPPASAPSPAPAATGRALATASDADLLAHARRTAAAAPDLDALEAAVAAFPWGGLKAQAGRTVFARGPRDAPVMLIGEGPGAEEDRQGLPFVGRSGQLLDKMLAAGGLKERTFITNTVFWRPPADRTPSQAEQALCRPFLERAISLVRPQVLLLVGGSSAKSLLSREEGILSLRGRWFDWAPEAGEATIPALATLHPAFLLRQPAAKKHAWLDILTLLSRLDPAAPLSHGLHT